MPTKLCPKCGKPISDLSCFCMYCGTQIEKDSQEVLSEETGEHSELNNAPLNTTEEDVSVSNKGSTKVCKSPKKNLSKIITIAVIALLFVVAALVGKGGNSKNEKQKENISATVSQICEKYGVSVQDVTFERTNTGYTIRKITCTKFSNLSYESMYSLVDEIQKAGEKDNFDCRYTSYEDSGDRYSITLPGQNDYHLNGLIEKNAKAVYPEAEAKWANELEIRENARKNQDNTTSTGGYQPDREKDAWVCAQDVVLSSLKSPASAKFCSYTEATVSYDYGADYTISGYVDAQNEFGATIRSYFVVTLTLTEKGYTNGYVVFS